MMGMTDTDSDPISLSLNIHWNSPFPIFLLSNELNECIYLMNVIDLNECI